jgi:hypothetical protein
MTHRDTHEHENVFSYQRGNFFLDINKRRDTIPEHFNSAEEAGEFWDSHSAAEYWDEMEEEEMEFDLRSRNAHF